MKIFLDDERPAPEGWVMARWPQEVIELLKTQRVEAISLDHDLGDDARGTGYDVIVWIEQEVAQGRLRPPRIAVHSANVPAREKMLAGIASIERLAARCQPSFLFVDAFATRRRMWRFMLREIMQFQGLPEVSISEASDAEGAVEFLAGNFVDVVLLDYEHDKDLQPVAKIRAACAQETKIILTTLNLKISQAAQAAGADHVIASWPLSAGLFFGRLVKCGVLAPIKT